MKKETSNIKIPKALKDDLKKEAIDKGLTLQSYIEEILLKRGTT